jgi:hypothetical protein
MAELQAREIGGAHSFGLRRRRHPPILDECDQVVINRRPNTV